MTSNVTIQAKKIELIQWLSSTEDTTILDKVIDLMVSERKKDWWLNTSVHEKNAIEKGLNDADNGKLNSHSKAKDIYGKWL